MNHWINIFDGLLLTQKRISGRIQKRADIFRENGCPKRLMKQLAVQNQVCNDWLSKEIDETDRNTES